MRVAAQRWGGKPGEVGTERANTPDTEMSCGGEILEFWNFFLKNSDVKSEKL